MGSAGVNLFFVISGFLITRILLGVRVSITQGRSDMGFALRAFFVRRLLRLFPALLFYLLIAVASGYFSDVEGLGWHVSYLSNFRMHQLQIWPRGGAHLWSLAVEEQFYLVIPFVVLWLRTRWLRNVFFAGIAVAFVATILGSPSIDLLPPAAFGGLFTGCAVAVVLDRDDGLTAASNRLAPFGVALMLAAFAYNDIETLSFNGSDTVGRTLFNFGAAGLVWTAVQGRAGRLLASAPAIRIGQLSYGIYLWHFFGEWIASGLIGSTAPTLARFAVTATVTFLLAHGSYVLVERRFTSKKSAFPYQRPEPDRSMVTSD